MSEIPQGASSEEQNTGRQLWTGELPHFHAGLALGQETEEKCVRLEVLREFGKADGKFLIPNCPSEAIRVPWEQAGLGVPATLSHWLGTLQDHGPEHGGGAMRCSRLECRSQSPGAHFRDCRAPRCCSERVLPLGVRSSSSLLGSHESLFLREAQKGEVSGETAAPNQCS